MEQTRLHALCVWTAYLRRRNSSSLTANGKTGSGFIQGYSTNPRPCSATTDTGKHWDLACSIAIFGPDRPRNGTDGRTHQTHPYHAETSAWRAAPKTTSTPASDPGRDLCHQGYFQESLFQLSLNLESLSQSPSVIAKDKPNHGITTRDNCCPAIL